jgi:hypothetical protein
LLSLREEKIRSTLLISCIFNFTEYEEHLPIRRPTHHAEALLLPHTRLLELDPLFFLIDHQRCSDS